MPTDRKLSSQIFSFNILAFATCLTVVPFLLSSCSDEKEVKNKPQQGSVAELGASRAPETNTIVKPNDPTKNPDGSLKWDQSHIIAAKKPPLTHYMKTGREQDPNKYYFPQMKDSQVPLQNLSSEQYTTNKFGVQYKDLEEGTGLVPGENGLTMIHYVAWLPDGTKFFSSLDNGLPVKFHMGERTVLPGIQYGIVGMKVGGTRKLIIPAKFAYGDKGLEGKVPPNSQIICLVKLLTTGIQRSPKH